MLLESVEHFKFCLLCIGTWNFQLENAAVLTVLEPTTCLDGGIRFKRLLVLVGVRH